MTFEMPSSTPQKKRVLIAGAGAFGLSTALYLQRYYKQNVEVLLLDSQPFPSVDSASGNDTSRAIRPDYADSFYADLGKDAVNAWRTDPVFSSHYRHSGRITAAAPGVPFVQKCRDALKTIGKEVEEFDEANKARGMKRKFPMLGDVEKLKGWDFYYNPVRAERRTHIVLVPL
jgi:glycine/D-amino acid oxidase-like deaminating enzyme